MQVRVRLSPGGPGERNGQPPGGRGVPGQERGERGPALFAGEERLHDGRRAGGLVQRPADRVGASGEQHHHDRRSGRDDLLDEPALQPGQLEGVRVIAFADGAAAEEARAVADDHDGHVRGTREFDRGGDAGGIRALDRHAVGVHDIAEPCRQRRADRRDVEAHRELGVMREHVVRERVAAHERLGAVAVRPDDRDASGGRGQRQHAVVPQQHGALEREPVRQGAVLGVVEVDTARRRGEVGVQESQVLLLGQHPGDRPVDEGLGQIAGCHPRGQAREGVGAGELHVDAGLEGDLRGFARRARDAVHRSEEVHREVVRHHRAVETPATPQQVGEQLARGGHGHAVDLGVGVHDGAHPAIADGHLERGQEDVLQLARSRVDGSVIAPGLRTRIPDEVLERRVDSGGLQAPDVRGADRADDVRVLGDALVDPPPPRVAHDIEHGGQALMHADLAHRASDGGCHEFDGLRIERRAPRERGREGRRLPGREAGEALLVHEGRDAQTRLPLQAPLLAPQPGGALDRVDRPGAVDAREVSEAVDRGIRVSGRGDLLAGAGRDDLVALVDPVPDELREFLVEGHVGDERLHAGRDAGSKGSADAGSVDGHAGQPFTAPVRPPTIRRSNRLKNTRAGIIDSEVNASTRAVSTEYCDANACVPRGSV